MRRMRSLFVTLLMLPLSFITSCERWTWTPEADAWFEVDGERYDLYIMVIDDPPYGIAPHNNTFGLTFQGATAYNISTSVSVPNTSVESGTYELVYFVSDGPSMNWVRILRGDTHENITSDVNSEGTLTVQASGHKYQMDFTGTIKGHQIKIHYNGLAGRYSG